MNKEEIIIEQINTLREVQNELRNRKQSSVDYNAICLVAETIAKLTNAVAPLSKI